MSAREEALRARLQAALSPLECRLIDESALHVGHAGAASGAGHYRLRIVAAAFEGKSRVGRHRMIYDCLSDMMDADIHALAITALAPSETSPGA